MATTRVSSFSFFFRTDTFNGRIQYLHNLSSVNRIDNVIFLLLLVNRIENVYTVFDHLPGYRVIRISCSITVFAMSLKVHLKR